MSETDREASLRNSLLVVVGFALLGVALVLVLFGGDLFSGRAEEPANVLDQVQPLQAGTPAALSAPNALDEAPDVGEVAPAFALADLAGNTVALADFRGRPVMVNFWATWCGPCIFEMPELQAAYEAYQDDGLVILALNRDEEVATVHRFYDEELNVDVTFPTLLDKRAEVANRYRIFNMPTTYFIDGTGTITAVHRGPLTQGQIDDYLAQMLSTEG